MSDRPYDVVIFDLDGTLTESEPGIVKSVQYALDKMDVRCDGMDLRAFIGPPLYESFTSLLGMDHEAATRAIELYRERFRAVGWRENSVYTGIPAMLRALKQNGVYLGIATAKPRPLTERILKFFNLEGYFDAITAVELSDRHVDKKQLVARILPPHFERAAMVGDRSYDMFGGRGNDIDAIGALYGYGSREELLENGATHLAESVEQLTGLLLGGAPRARGKLVALEGPDGCGKSTQQALLADWLRQCGHRVVCTREPGGCPISERIRNLVLDVKAQGMSDECEMLLFAAARAQHVHDLIRPALERGDLVLCDRFVDSSIAYQGYGRGLGEQVVRAVNAPAVAECTPDLTLMLMMDPAQALARRTAAEQPDRIESDGGALARRVYEGYLSLARSQPDRVLTLDAGGDREQVLERLREALAGRI